MTLKKQTAEFLLSNNKDRVSHGGLSVANFFRDTNLEAEADAMASLTHSDECGAIFFADPRSALFEYPFPLDAYQSSLVRATVV